MQIIQSLSPNFSESGGVKKLGFVIHGTIGKYEGACEWLKTPAEKRPTLTYSSAHFVIAKDGRCTQLVPIEKVSWHAGTIKNPTERAKKFLLKNILGAYKNPNSYLIGIELEYFPGDIIPEAQMKMLLAVIKACKISNPIVLSHKEITDYKSDFTTVNGVMDYSVINGVISRLNLYGVAVRTS